MHFRHEPLAVKMTDYDVIEVDTATDDMSTIIWWAWLASILLLFFSLKGRTICCAPEWEKAGYYRLTSPQTLTKAERDLLRRMTPVNVATLYKSTCDHCGSNRWKYMIAGTWFYPSASSVEQRAIDESGNPIDIV